MATIYILTQDDREIARVTSERAAKAAARSALEAWRISEYATSDGWCYYPTGDRDDNGPIVTVSFE